MSSGNYLLIVLLALAAAYAIFRIVAEGKPAGKNVWHKSKKRQRPASFGRSSTGGIRDRNACIATSRSAKSTGTITRPPC